MRTALGKGLNALISDDAVAAVSAAPTTKSSTPTTLPIDQIRPNPKQPRRDFSNAALEELAGSIKQKGVLQPIIVTPVQGPKSKVQVPEPPSSTDLGPET